MDSSSAKMKLIMTPNMECKKCRMKVQQVLENVHGPYSIDIDAEQDEVKVSGMVNPKIIMQLFDGPHAKIKSVKFDAEDPYMAGGYPPHMPHFSPYETGHFPYGGGGPYPTRAGPYNYPMMMPPPPVLMLPPPHPPQPSSSVAMLPPKPPTLLLEAPPKAASDAAAQPKSTETSAPKDASAAKVSKSGDNKQCRIIRWAKNRVHPKV